MRIATASSMAMIRSGRRQGGRASLALMLMRASIFFVFLFLSSKAVYIFFFAGSKGAEGEMAQQTLEEENGDEKCCRYICDASNACEGNQPVCIVGQVYSSFLSEDLVALRFEQTQMCAITPLSFYQHWLQDKQRELIVETEVPMVASGENPFGFRPSTAYMDALILKLLPRCLELDRPRVLVLGLGGGKAAHTLDNLLPTAQVDLVDVDEAMIYAAQKWYCAPNRKSFRYISADAYTFVASAVSSQYHVILVDVFKGADIPEKFLTVSFFEQLKRQLPNMATHNVTGGTGGTGISGLIGMNIIPTELLHTEGLLEKANSIFNQQCMVEFIAGPSGTNEDGNAMLICFT